MPKILCWIIPEVILPDAQTHGHKLKAILGPCHQRVYHRRYEGSFVEVTIPDKAKRLIEVISTQSG